MKNWILKTLTRCTRWENPAFAGMALWALGKARTLFRVRPATRQRYKAVGLKVRTETVDEKDLSFEIDEFASSAVNEGSIGASTYFRDPIASVVYRKRA